MKVLVSGTTRTVAKLAAKWPDHLGVLLAPHNRNSMKAIAELGLPWAMDNGAFSGFDAERFSACCIRASYAPTPPLWVVCPDVVADAKATMELFSRWCGFLMQLGLPVAFVGQDGQEDLPIQWYYFSCLFLGGSTAWKESNAAADLAREAKARGKLVHMGRVNSFRRLAYAQEIGCDSVDGSSMSMFGDAHVDKFCRWVRRLEGQKRLFA